MRSAEKFLNPSPRDNGIDTSSDASNSVVVVNSCYVGSNASL